MKFSIIIPVYNSEKYLRECLDSVLEQSVADWEAVCIDDGSNDNSSSILDAYAARDRRFKVMHVKNGGEGSARNHGLEVAKGEWVVYLDSDDVIKPSELADVSAAVEKYPAVQLVAFGCFKFSEDCKPVLRDESDQVVPRREVSYADMTTTLPTEVLGRGVCCLAYRRSHCGHLRFTDLKLGADLVYVSECLCVLDSVAFIDVANYGYRQRASSMCHKERTPEMMIDMIRFCRMVCENYVHSGKTIPAAYKRNIVNRWIESTAFHIANKPYAGPWGGVWDYWFDSFHGFPIKIFMTRWQRFVVRLACACRSRLLVIFLCVGPYWLKTKGLHR